MVAGINGTDTGGRPVRPFSMRLFQRWDSSLCFDQEYHGHHRVLYFTVYTLALRASPRGSPVTGAWQDISFTSGVDGSLGLAHDEFGVPSHYVSVSLTHRQDSGSTSTLIYGGFYPGV